MAKRYLDPKSAALELTRRPQPPQKPTGWRVIPEAFWNWVIARGRGLAWGTAALLLVLIAVVSVVGAAKNVSGDKLTVLAYLLSIATLAAAAYLLGLTLRENDSKLSSLVIGDDKRTSTSKVQLLLWTVGVAFALAYISSRTILGPGTFVCNKGTPQTNCVPDGDIWTQYLILLGVPAAAAVIAKGVTTYKVVNGIVQKTDAGQAAGADIATDDNGKADLVDVQYLVFNVIAFVYFFAHFIREGTFVSVPDLLLGLTSASAATYTLNKAVQSAKPRITSVTPSHIRPASSVTVIGQNLFPIDGTATVKIGDAVLALERIPGVADSARFTAPVNLADGPQALTVMTPAAVETEPYTVVCEAPKVLGWAGKPAEKGKPVDLQLSMLPDENPPQFKVTVGAVSLDATPDPVADTLAITLPATLVAGDYDVTVSANGFEYATSKSKLHVK